MGGHTAIPEDEDIPCLVQQGHWHTTDLLSISQAPTKIKAQVQQKVNNSQHHSHRMHPKQEDHMQLYFQNVNGINTEEDIKSYLDAIHEHEVDIWGWSETNIKWTPNMISKNKCLSNKCFDNFTLTSSLSDDPAEHKQQGGTCVGVSNKITGRIIAMDNDFRGLGRWSLVSGGGTRNK
eukprot:13239477-Ditylum_brightwellii.AAC.1